ncbi:MAG: hypothetical protein H6Q66_1056 [Firmicutes bacterium]|nr:hypothetical protein [Bacillota bacterium]
MAEKAVPSQTKKVPTSTMKIIIIIILMIFLMILGIGAGVFYGLGKTPELVAKYKLYDYPLVGQFFPRPKTNFDTIEIIPDNTKDAAPLIMPSVTAALPNTQTEPLKTPILPQDAELAKQQKALQIESAKRISKLARLYGSMKPEEAVPILSKLDDEIILSILGKMEEEQVAKLLPLFDAQKAASLTQMMLKGNINR